MKYTFKGNFGTLELIITPEGKATGSYQKDGVLEGTWADNIFTGEWSNQGMEGLVRFTVADGNLKGNWKKGKDAGPMRGSWKGEVISQEGKAPDAPPSIPEPVAQVKPVAPPPPPAPEEPVTSPLAPIKEEIVQLYDAEDYAGVLALFDENKEELGEDEDIVHKYLFAMWFNGGLEDQILEKIRGFEDKFETDRWLKLRGYYYEHKRYYDSALEAYKETSEILYKAVKEKFDQYNALFTAEKYTEVVAYFESELSLSVSKNTLEVAEKYCDALFWDSDTERKALAQARKFRESFPEHEEFTKMNGRYARHLGFYNLDLDLLQEAMACFKQTKSERNIGKTQEEIKEVKQKLKEKAAAEKKAEKEAVAEEKRAAREAAASEKQAAREAEAAEKKAAKEASAAAKMQEHRFKSARGLTFCQFCGEERQWAGSVCSKRKAGHNFVMQKYDGELQPMCNRCGENAKWSGMDYCK